MPAAPELGNAAALVGRKEVGRNLEPQPKRHPDGNITIPAEITVYHHSVAVEGYQVF